MDESEIQIHTAQMGDTGLGREAGYKDDAELIAAAKKQQAELKAMLTPEAWARLEAAKREFERRILFGE